MQGSESEIFMIGGVGSNLTFDIVIKIYLLVALAGTNIAVYRKATQISNFHGDFHADLATDGNEFGHRNPINFEQKFWYYSCTLTRSESNPWLVVDLGQSEEIQKVLSFLF